MSQPDSPHPSGNPSESPLWREDEELPPMAPQQIVPKPNFVPKKSREEAAAGEEADTGAASTADTGGAAGDAPAAVVVYVTEPGPASVDPRPERQLAPADPIPGLDGETLPSPNEHAVASSPVDTGEAAAGPDTAPPPAATEARQPAPAVMAVPAPAGGLSPIEKRWLGILLATLVVAGGLVAYLLRDGLPADSRYLATLSPQLPLKGEKITIVAARAGWRQLGTAAEGNTREGLRITPAIDFEFTPESSGALRIFFRNERDQQAGDTINLEIQGGKVVGTDAGATATCSRGLRTVLEYADLSASENAYWSIEIHEGSDPRGPMSGYTLLAKLHVPWNLPPQSQQ